MSIQSLPPRINTHLGRFALALLLGAVLALSGLLPAVALAHTQGQAVAFSPDPNYILDKAGVSLVRLEVTYSAGDNSTTKSITSCTGLGVIVSSKPAPSSGASSPGAFQNWVLTDASLLNSSSPCQLANATTETIQVWANDAYTQSHSSPVALGELTCTLGAGVPACEDENVNTPEQALISSTLPALFSFQTTSEQPYLTLAPSSSTAFTTLGLTNATSQVFPSVKFDATGPNRPQDYLVPVVVPPTDSNAGSPAANAQSSPTPTSTLPKGVELGAPLVDASGRLAEMYVNGGTPLNLRDLAQSIGAQILAAPSPHSLTTLWDTGMDAFNQGTLASCQQARTSFQSVSALNPNFKAATALLARAQTCAQPTTSGPPPQALPKSSSLPFMIILIAGLVVLALALIVVTLWVGRARRHRRELAQFEAEHAEGQRRAKDELERRNTQTRESLCPQCHHTVRVSDTMCPHCRYPLSPSASGLHVRVTGSGPLPATVPMPPPQSWPKQMSPSAPSVSDMPTLQLPPNFAAGGEITSKRSKSRQTQEKTYKLQHAPMSTLSLAVGTCSDPGLKRKYKPNEDSLLAIQGVRTHNSQPQPFGLFVVADGMGGHANGQDASRTAIQTIIDYLLPKVSTSEVVDDEAFKKLLSDGVQTANFAVHNRNLESHADMGTTMTAALVIGTAAYVANVGDSRTYRYTKDQGLAKVTMDHSVVASLVEAGIIQPDDIYTHPKRNQIYRSLGEKPVVEVDTFKVDVQPGDKLLLCSDGLWDMVRDPLIQEVMSQPAGDPNKTGQELIKAALQGGGEDNVTVIVVQFAEPNTRKGMTGVQLHAKPDTVTIPDLPPL